MPAFIATFGRLLRAGAAGAATYGGQRRRWQEGLDSAAGGRQRPRGRDQLFQNVRPHPASHLPLSKVAEVFNAPSWALDSDMVQRLQKAVDANLKSIS